MEESGVVWQLVFYNLREQGNVWVGVFLEMKMMPGSGKLSGGWVWKSAISFFGKNHQSIAFLWKSDSNSTI
jgi:hypothetical protein